jgi:hypothetical protein
MEIAMSQEAVERLLGRLLTDDIFRKKAEESMEVLCRESGYNLNTEELKAITRDDINRIDTVSKKLNTNIKPFRVTPISKK